jgi:hypothetical protein
MTQCQARSRLRFLYDALSGAWHRRSRTVVGDLPTPSNSNQAETLDLGAVADLG